MLSDHALNDVNKEAPALQKRCKPVDYCCSVPDPVSYFNYDGPDMTHTHSHTNTLEGKGHK